MVAYNIEMCNLANVLVKNVMLVPDPGADPGAVHHQVKEKVSWHTWCWPATAFHWSLSGLYCAPIGYN
jgi:hypothetical protein